MLGRISQALTDVMDQDTLLAYLSHCSSSDVITAADFRVEDYDDVMKTVELIFEWMNDIWKLIQSGCFREVLNALSSWKEELATFTTDSSSCVLAFTRQYLKVVKMLAKIWPHFLSPRKLSSSRMGDLSLQLEKLDWILREMRYRFIGLSKQEELHVLELLLLNSALRLSSIEAYCESTTLKRLCTTLSLVELLHKELAIGPSNFVAELKKSLDEIDVSADAPFYNPFLF